MLESPISVLVGQDGVELAVSQSQVILDSQSGIVIAGSSSNGSTFFKVNDEGELFVVGTLTTTPSGVQQVSGTVDVGNIVTGGTNEAQIVNQGEAGTASESWFVSITDGTSVLGTEANPLAVSGTLGVETPLEVFGEVGISGTVDIGTVAGTVTVDGTVDIGNVVTVSGTVGIADQPIEVFGSVSSSIDGVVDTREANATVAATSNVAATTTSTTALAANPDRRGAIFYMDGNSVAFIKFGATASQTSYTVKVTRDGYFQVPAFYTGIIDVVFNNTNGTLRVTEITD
jgi:hypothetical protein